MNTLDERYASVCKRIRLAATGCGRSVEDVALLAVSKTRPIEDIHALLKHGQLAFGENYLQEAIPKIEAIKNEAAEWHFIGPAQSNKTRQISEHFDWVHSVDRLKIARRLNDHRHAWQPELNICIQVNIDNQATKSGISPEQVPELCSEICKLPRLKLRGLMTIPAPSEDYENQRKPFRRLRELQDQLIAEGYTLDTLSMGMSSDLEAAIAEGSTMIRVGTDIFGPRPKQGIQA